MSIGKSSVRTGCPLPFGLRIEQFYNWAKRFLNWTQTFTSAAAGIVGSTSSVADERFEYWGKVSANSADGDSCRFHLVVTECDASTAVNRKFWVCAWLASMPFAAPYTLAWTHTMCTGQMIWSQPQSPDWPTGGQPRLKYILTNSGGSAMWRANPAAAVYIGYMHVQIDNGLVLYWPTQVSWGVA